MRFTFSLATMALLSVALASPIASCGTHSHTSEAFEREAKDPATNAVWPFAPIEEDKRDVKGLATNAVWPFAPIEED
jgi:hypothetical protein